MRSIIQSGVSYFYSEIDKHATETEDPIPKDDSLAAYMNERIYEIFQEIIQKSIDKTTITRAFLMISWREWCVRYERSSGRWTESMGSFSASQRLNTCCQSSMRIVVKKWAKAASNNIYQTINLNEAERQIRLCRRMCGYILEENKRLMVCQLIQRKYNRQVGWRGWWWCAFEQSVFFVDCRWCRLITEVE